MAPSQQQCAKYQYVITPEGPRVVPVPDIPSKNEESASDYNVGGYLPVKVGDVYKNGRYKVVRKLGCVLVCPYRLIREIFTLYFAISILQLGSFFHRLACSRHSPERSLRLESRQIGVKIRRDGSR